MATLLFMLLLNSITASPLLWKEYPSYACDVTTSAFKVEYELSFPQCQTICANTTECKGISWYQYVKKDVPFDPSRCYLLNKICPLQFFDSSPTFTSFWYNDLSTETPCIDYPYSPLWSDRYNDDCNIYASYKLCENAFNQSSMKSILNDHDTVYNLNAFQTCCSCSGSLFEYKPNNIGFLMESSWKPSQNTYITDNIVCQTYNKDEIKVIFAPKWDINWFLGVCDYFTKNADNKFRTIYSLSTSIKEDLKSIDYQRLHNFDCINDHLFMQNTVTFYLCNAMDYANYAYIIDISSPNHTVYLNGYFIDITDFEDNLKNNEITVQNQCNIESLINNNDGTNIIGIFVCELSTEAPTKYPSVSPTLKPTRPPTKRPTSKPTISPTLYPSLSPTLRPTWYPTVRPTQYPTVNIYSEKKQVTAFCLTFFLGGFGAGRFYAGDDSAGTWQLLLIIFGCCAGCCAMYFFDNYEEGAGQATGGCAFCCYLAWFIWWIADLVAIGKGNWEDDDGRPLEPW